MIINVHAGHNPDGKIACGAAKFIKESTEARKVKDEVICLLRLAGHTVYDCTVNDGTSQADVLTKIVKKCNAHKADLDVSIHFNAGAGDLNGNGKTTGAEVLVYSASSGAKTTAGRICSKIAELGFRNRGVKYNPNLYVLRKTTSPALLVECCFVDDKDDVQLYDYIKMARAIAEGITGQTITPVISGSGPITAKGIDYSSVFDAQYYAAKYPDLSAAFGTDKDSLLNHFVNFGMKEHRQAIAVFNPVIYRDRYADLQKAFGDDWTAYYLHYIQHGQGEERKAY